MIDTYLIWYTVVQKLFRKNVPFTVIKSLTIDSARDPNDFVLLVRGRWAKGPKKQMQFAFKVLDGDNGNMNEPIAERIALSIENNIFPNRYVKFAEWLEKETDKRLGL